MDAEKHLAAVQGLARALASDVVDNDAVAISIVGERTPGSPSLNSVFGYLYKVDGDWLPWPADLGKVASHYELLIEATCDDGGAGWFQSVFQLGAPSGKVKLQFEHDDPERWKVIPPHWNDLPSALRPEFAPPAT